MKRISEFLTKPVISLYDSKTEGIIKTVYFDKTLRKLKWFILFDNEEHAEEKALKTSDVFSLGENAIVVRNDECLNLELTTINSNDKTSPINNSVYTTKGKFMGVVVDIEIDEKFNTKNIILDTGNIIGIKKVASSGTDALILQDDGKEIKVGKYKKKFPTINVKQSGIVKIMADKAEELKEETTILNNTIEEDKIENEPAESIIKINPDKKTESKTRKLKKDNKNPIEIKQKVKPSIKYVLEQKEAIPNRIITNCNFLLGRVVEKNIYSQNNVLLAKKGSKVTEKTIDAVKENYKLRELTQFSK